MKAHPKELSVQMAATACLYNLSKMEMGQKIHPMWLGKLVELTLDAMQNFPNHQQVNSYQMPFCHRCSKRLMQQNEYVNTFIVVTLVLICRVAAEECVADVVQ